MRIAWTPSALRDLEAIGDHIGRANPAAAARTVTRIFDRVEMLCAHSEMGRPGRAPNTRELVVTDTPFVVPYRVRDDVVEILAVFHGARKWPDSF
jgi:addiction module RelE/StbE family toxin